MQRFLLPASNEPASPAPTRLERDLEAYNESLDKLCQQLMRQMDVYRGLVAKNEFEVLKLEHIYDWAPGGVATITLTGRINQLIVFDRLFYTLPTTVTSMVVIIGREQIPFSFASGSPFNNTIPVQFILGGADTIKATISPVPSVGVGGNTPIWGFGLFGHKSGHSTQEI